MIAHPSKWLAAVIKGMLGLYLAFRCMPLNAQTSQGGPPNIVFILSDDHAYQAISAYND